MYIQMYVHTAMLVRMNNEDSDSHTFCWICSWLRSLQEICTEFPANNLRCRISNFNSWAQQFPGSKWPFLDKNFLRPEKLPAKSATNKSVSGYCSFSLIFRKVFISSVGCHFVSRTLARACVSTSIRDSMFVRLDRE